MAKPAASGKRRATQRAAAKPATAAKKKPVKRTSAKGSETQKKNAAPPATPHSGKAKRKGCGAASGKAGGKARAASAKAKPKVSRPRVPTKNVVTLETVPYRRVHCVDFGAAPDDVRARLIAQPPPGAKDCRLFRSQKAKVSQDIFEAASDTFHATMADNFVATFDVEYSLRDGGVARVVTDCPATQFVIPPPGPGSAPRAAGVPLRRATYAATSRHWRSLDAEANDAGYEGASPACGLMAEEGVCAEATNFAVAACGPGALDELQRCRKLAGRGCTLRQVREDVALYFGA